MAPRSSIQSPQEFGSTSGDASGDAAGIGEPETGSGSDSGTIDPAKLETGSGGNGNNSGSGSGKKRGRKPGWKKSPPTGGEGKATQSLDIASLNELIYNGHLLLAKAAKIPELRLDEEEAKKLADATANVARHYNIAISQKTLDITNLITAVSTIYGSRIMAIANNKRISKMNGGKPIEPKPSIFTPPVYNAPDNIKPMSNVKAAAENIRSMSNVSSTNPYADAAVKLHAQIHGNA